MPKSFQRKSKKVNKTTTKKRVNKNKKRSNRNKRSQSQRGGSIDNEHGKSAHAVYTPEKFLLETICLGACKIMTPMLRTFYIAINSDNSPYKTEKEDKSIFTIADGMVQYLLKDVLFKDKFMGIVGEESSVVEININDDKNNVADYSVTEEGKAPIKIHPGFKPIIDETKKKFLN